MKNFRKIFNLLHYTPRIKLHIEDLINKNIMIMAPHPDDETLGCGGMIQKLLLSGNEIKLLLYTNGQSEQDALLRMSEFIDATYKLGLNDTNLLSLGLKDGTLTDHCDAVAGKVESIIKKEDPKWIFIPYLLDTNKDHLAVHQILSNILTEDSDIHIVMYEIWTPILYPDLYLNITDFYNRKEQAAQCYYSQEKKYGILKKMRHLNQFRASQIMKREYKFVEAYKIFSASDYLEILTDFIGFHKGVV